MENRYNSSQFRKSKRLLKPDKYTGRWKYLKGMITAVILLWISTSVDAQVFEDIVTTFSVRGETFQPSGMTIGNDGRSIFTITNNTPRAVFRYDMAVPFDLKTARYTNQSFVVNSQESGATGVALNTDGTKMYVVGLTDRAVVEYTLSTPFDLTTATHAGTAEEFSVNSEDSSPQDLTFNADGSRMYVVGNTNESVYQYDLSTPFDVSTAVYNSVSISAGPSPRGLAFNTSGSAMYIVGGDQTFAAYTLSEPFNIATAVRGEIADEISFSNAEISPQGVAVSPDENRLYVIGLDRDNIIEYIRGSVPTIEISLKENSSSAIIDIDANDDMGGATDQNIIYSLTGTDAINFDISSSGVISPSFPFDFENPVDGNMDNVYELSVNARLNSTTISKGLEFTVLDEGQVDLINTLPAAGSVDVPINSSITLNFDNPIDVSTVSPSTVMISGDQSDPIDGIFSFPQTNSIVFDPTNNFADEETITVTITEGVSAIGAGETMTRTSFSFTTFTQVPPVIVDQSFDVLQGIPNGGVVGNVVASDGNGQALTYSITAGNTDEAFRISAATGALSVNNTEAIDVAVNPSFMLTVEVTDGIQFVSATITVNVDTTTPIIEEPVANYFLGFQADVPSAMTFNDDGSRMYVINNSGNREIFAYDLEIPYELNTARFANEKFSVVSQESGPTGLAFNTTGDKMFITGFSDDAVVEYNLTTPFDVSTASYSQEFSVVVQDSSPQDVTFSTDGSRMYIVGNINNAVFQYDLSTPFDVSTATYNNVTIPSGSAPRGITLSDDGTIMYIVGGDQTFAEYSLTEPFNIATASRVDAQNEISFNNLTVSPQGVVISNDNSRIYLVELGADRVYQYFRSTITVNFLEGRISSVININANNGAGGVRDSVDYSLTGVDASLFNIDKSGIISFNAVPDFESPQDDDNNNVYELEVVASNASESASRNIEVTVLDGVDNIFPIVANPIPDQVFKVSDVRPTVDITNVFSDADGDDLRISFSIANTAVTNANLVTFTTSTQKSIVFFDMTVGVTEVTVNAFDDRGGIVSETFTVTIEEANRAPVISDQTFSIAENSDVDTSVGFITASDADGDQLTYSITTGNSNTAFAIDDNTGELLVSNREALDFETTPSFSLTVTVNDGSGGTDDAVVTVNLTDVVENSAPIVANPIPNQLLQAGFATTTIELMDVFDDADQDVLTLSVSVDNIDVVDVAISETTLTLTEEGTGTVTVTVTADDNQGGMVSDVFTVSVNSAPTVINALEDRVISEEGGRQLYDLSPVFSDADGDQLTYTVQATNAGTVADVGILNQLVTVDPLAIGVTEITVEASDNNGGSISDTFTVTIEAANAAPVILDQTFNIAENSTVDTSVGFINASDENGDALIFSIITGNTNDAFALDNNTGELLVNKPEELNFESTPTFSLTISVSDGKGETDSAVITINVTEAVENTSPAIENQTFTIVENFEAFLVIGDVIATDPDGDQLTYEITDGNIDNTFDINDAGELFAASSDALDFEVNPNFTLTVQVSDGKGGVASATITVNLTDIDEIAPEFTSESSVNFTENSSSTAYVIMTNEEATFELGTTNDEQLFSLSNGNEVSFINAPDFDNPQDADQNNEYLLDVIATDPAGNRATLLLKITVIEEIVNTAPILTDQTLSIAENSSNGTSVGFISASDADGDALTYSITSGNINDAFTIDGNTGELLVNKSEELDFETTPSFRLTVEVTDGSASVSGEVTINLTDENEVVSSIINKDTDIQFYPNPAADYIKIESNVVVKEATILTMEGKEVRRFVSGVQIESIDIGQLKPGTYLLILTSTTTSISHRFVKQ